MSGPVFIYHNGVLVLVLWLKFVPEKTLEKIWEGSKVKNSDIFQLLSTKSDSGQSSFRKINGGKVSAR